MAKRPSVTAFARPKSSSVADLETRIDTAAEALKPQETATPPKKVQRSREGMAKVTIHMKPEARNMLKIAGLKQNAGLEEYILAAINAKLVADGEDFQIG